jgi:hypothetical protein
MNLEKNSIKKINEIIMKIMVLNLKKKNKNKVWNWKENQLEEGWKTK